MITFSYDNNRSKVRFKTSLSRWQINELIFYFRSTSKRNLSTRSSFMARAGLRATPTDQWTLLDWNVNDFKLVMCAFHLNSANLPKRSRRRVRCRRNSAIFIINKCSRGKCTANRWRISTIHFLRISRVAHQRTQPRRRTRRSHKWRNIHQLSTAFRCRWLQLRVKDAFRTPTPPNFSTTTPLCIHMILTSAAKATVRLKKCRKAAFARLRRRSKTRTRESVAGPRPTTSMTMRKRTRLWNEQVFWVVRWWDVLKHKADKTYRNVHRINLILVISHLMASLRVRY